MIFAPPSLGALELDVLAKIDELRKSLAYQVSQSKRWTGLLRRVSFARAIRGSSSIEGYNVTVDDAIAATDGEEPLDAQVRDWLAVKGYRDAMSYVLQLSDDPHFSYDASLLRSLHYMMTHHEPTKNPGRWRPGPVYVRDDARGAIVYDAPAAPRIPALIQDLIAALNTPDDIPVLVRAAMAHLNLVMIHPFSDGNGRMARCLQTIVLARDQILSPHFCSIEEYLGAFTKEYYAVLAAVGAGSWHPERDASEWVRFNLGAHFNQATTMTRRAKEVSNVWAHLEDEAKKRGLPERVVYALVDAAFGLRVRNATYRNVAEISNMLASHDLKALVDQHLLVPHGEKRGRFYLAAPVLIEVRQRMAEPRTNADPFQSSARKRR